MKNVFFYLGLIYCSLSLQGCALLSAAGLSSQGQPTKEVTGDLESTTANSIVNVDHSQWDSLLKKYVNQEGLVDYTGFKKDSLALQSYLDSLSNYTPDSSWSVQELLAFYINLYNAHTVKLITDHPDVSSIKDIDGPWTKAIVPVGDKMLSLGGIENGILRKMNEPRIHFAINCASISCPKILTEAYTAAKINEQLERATRSFINSDKNDIQTNSAQVSKIFDWYAKDYTQGKYKTVKEFINAYSNVKMDPSVKLEYKAYDWGLNAQKR